MIRRVSNMKPEEIFTRCVFAAILIGSFFVPWGRWVALILGVLFLISALQGFCVTCWFYKTFFQKGKYKKDD